MDGFGLLSTMFVYNDAVGHVTCLWPPDWVLPRIAASHGTAGIVRLIGSRALAFMAAEAM